MKGSQVFYYVKVLAVTTFAFWIVAIGLAIGAYFSPFYSNKTTSSITSLQKQVAILTNEVKSLLNNTATYYLGVEEIGGITVSSSSSVPIVFNQIDYILLNDVDVSSSQLYYNSINGTFLMPLAGFYQFSLLGSVDISVTTIPDDYVTSISLFIYPNNYIANEISVTYDFYNLADSSEQTYPISMSMQLYYHLNDTIGVYYTATKEDTTMTLQDLIFTIDYLGPTSYSPLSEQTIKK